MKSVAGYWPILLAAGDDDDDGIEANIPPRREKYDVFINFRGEDTRDGITSHLHAALLQKKIETYIDNRLHKGEEIGPALLEAVEKSTLSVIIFSQNYASSKRCLDELVHILECKKRYGHMVIPVFYDINPSDVRKQHGSYAGAFAQLEKRFKDNIDKVHKWRDALKTAADLSGFDYSNKRG
ncbi:TMV resistance protein N-like [Pyrus ussuriensis x Pyrus communis]|uniref:TMV resistance protein N-like n=1 Tax=Pyrus ussuriensis x Pyrus communis TaxID=2448454 RepID=A0A5N5HC14_9ROSA|nr:TMV resistance protein N-like [Pyrus ussuriensis x Pyrus communis]